MADKLLNLITELSTHLVIQIVSDDVVNHQLHTKAVAIVQAPA
jgi:hypothetical protein